MMRKNVGMSYCRVIATMFIVICHVIRYYTMIPFSQHMEQFFNVGVEMFIILSGYLYGGKKIYDFKKFYFQRYLKICLPIQIWTLVIFIFSKGGEVSLFLIYFLNVAGLRSINKGLLSSAAVGSLGHTWFVTIIVLCYLLIPFMQKICSKYKKEKVFCGLFLLWIITGIIALYGTQIYYFTLFLSAYYVAYYGIKPKKSKTVPGGYWMYSFITIAVSAGRLLLRLDLEHAWFYDEIYVHISQSLLAVWIMITICAIYKGRKNFMDFVSGIWWYQGLEKLSYLVYIVHYCLIGITYGRYGIPIAGVAFGLMTVCVSAVFYKVNRRIEQGIYKLGSNMHTY